MSSAPASLDRFPRLDQFLCFSVYAAGHALTRAYKPLLEPLGLTYPQYLVMVALWEQDDQTVGGLGAALSLESNTLTPLLKRLEAMGHLSRRRDSRDERQVRVRLTDQGRALEAQARAVPGGLLAATGLGLPELIDLQQRMTALRHSIDTHLGAPS